MQICVYKRMIKINCISSYFNFVFHQRRDQQEAFFGGIFPQKAEPQHHSQRALLSSRGLTWLEFIAFKISCIYFIFLQVFDVSCFNLGGSIKPLDY